MSVVISFSNDVFRMSKKVKKLDRTNLPDQSPTKLIQSRAVTNSLKYFSTCKKLLIEEKLI